MRSMYIPRIFKLYFDSKLLDTYIELASSPITIDTEEFHFGMNLKLNFTFIITIC